MVQLMLAKSNRDLLPQDRLIIYALYLFLFFEVASGALRFYLSYVSLVQFIYLPKFFVFAVFVFFLVKDGFSKALGVLLVLVILGAFVGLLRGFDITNILFSVYMLGPLFFGYTCGRKHDVLKPHYYKIFSVLFFIAVFGVFFDYAFSVPWKGFEYTLGDAVIEGSRDWSTVGVDRLAGFSRVSASTGILIALFSSYMIIYMRSYSGLLVVLFLSFSAIALTTNKASLLGLLCALFVLFSKKNINLINLLAFSLIIFCVVLPFSTCFVNYDIDLSSESSEFLLSSFSDRLVRTWPGFIDIVNSYNLSEFGVGLGGVGAALKLFTVDAAPGVFLYSLAVADSTVLYLWGIFGFLGVFIFVGLGWVIKRLLAYSSLDAVGFVSSMVAILAISLTTDVIESPACLVFIGIALGILDGFCRSKNVRKEVAA